MSRAPSRRPRPTAPSVDAGARLSVDRGVAVGAVGAVGALAVRTVTGNCSDGQEDLVGQLRPLSGLLWSGLDAEHDLVAVDLLEDDAGVRTRRYGEGALEQLLHVAGAHLDRESSPQVHAVRL